MEPQIDALKNLFGDLFAKLMAFTLEDEYQEALGEALEVFYNMAEGEEYEFNPTEEFLFLSWFLLDDTDAEGNALIDEFLARYSDDLTLQETQICKALKETHLTLLQVKEITPGRSISLRDVFLGEDFEVFEAAGSAEGIHKDSILYTRVLRLGDMRFLVGAGVFLDPVVMEPLTQFVTDQYREECEDGQKVSFKQFLKENGELINWWIRALEQGELLEGGEDGEKPDGDDGDGDKTPPSDDKNPPDTTPAA
ncbi:MAG TPA: hypothetical protein PLP29_13320 [Candidatus Ozemobacteraceae bacterium]|nr:hypothetical protein [Candidatus Ozemobacteraceae bacterium]